MLCHPLSHGYVYMDANIQVTFCLKNSFGHLSVSVVYSCVFLNMTYGYIFWFKYRWKTTFEIWTSIMYLTVVWLTSSLPLLFYFPNDVSVRHLFLCRPISKNIYCCKYLQCYFVFKSWASMHFDFP